MDVIARKNIVMRIQEIVRMLNGFYWLLDCRTTVAHVANEFLRESEAASLSWNEQELLTIWNEATAQWRA